MKLVVGLGNPGKEYENTRHNVGFMFLERYAKANNATSFKKAFKGEYSRISLYNEDVILFKPLTYMNLSGEAIREVVSYFKIDLNDIVVIYDDKDIPFAALRLREKGNPGSHNGMKNITSLLNSNEFKRIRVGIGAPESNKDMINYVLSKFSSKEISVLEETFDNLAKAIDLFVKNDFNKAMNDYNFKKKDGTTA